MMKFLVKENLGGKVKQQLLELHEENYV
jgi:hypothetical protein